MYVSIRRHFNISSPNYSYHVWLLETQEKRRKKNNLLKIYRSWRKDEFQEFLFFYVFWIWLRADATVDLVINWHFLFCLVQSPEAIRLSIDKFYWLDTSILWSKSFLFGVDWWWWTDFSSNAINWIFGAEKLTQKIQFFIIDFSGKIYNISSKESIFISYIFNPDLINFPFRIIWNYPIEKKPTKKANSQILNFFSFSTKKNYSRSRNNNMEPKRSQTRNVINNFYLTFFSSIHISSLFTFRFNNELVLYYIIELLAMQTYRKMLNHWIRFIRINWIGFRKC